MHSEDFFPAIPLRPFIKSYKIIESTEERVNRIVPGTALALAFRFRGQTNYIHDDQKHPLPSATLSGLRKSVRLINYLGHSSTLIVLFKEAGAAAFFRAPLHELFEESIALSSFIPAHEAAQIEEQLAEAWYHHQRIKIVEKFLLGRLVPTNDKLVSTAVQRIHMAKGNIRIHELIGSLYLSTDAFEKRFRKVIGTSPKQFASLVRMRSIIHSVSADQPIAHQALDAGYFDQSHFNKDFKLFTGQSPTDFLRSPVFW